MYNYYFYKYSCIIIGLMMLLKRVACLFCLFGVVLAQESLPPLTEADVVVLSAEPHTSMSLFWGEVEDEQKRLVLKSDFRLEYVSKVSIKGFDSFGNTILNLDRWWNAPFEADESYGFLVASDETNYNRLEVSLYDEKEHLVSRFKKDFPATIYDEKMLSTSYFTKVNLKKNDAKVYFEYVVESESDSPETPLQIQLQVFRGRDLAYEHKESLDLVGLNGDPLVGVLEIENLAAGSYIYKLRLLNDEIVLSEREGPLVMGDHFVQINTVSEASDSLTIEGLAIVPRESFYLAYEGGDEQTFGERAVRPNQVGKFEMTIDLKSLKKPIKYLVLAPGMDYESKVEVARYEVISAINTRLTQAKEMESTDPVYVFSDDEPEVEKREINVALLFVLLSVVFVLIAWWLRKRWKRSHLLWFVMLGAAGSASASTVAPVVSWEHPASTEVLGFTNNSSSDFRFMQLSGEVFDPLLYTGFFDASFGIGQVSVQFSKGGDARRYTVESLLLDPSVYELGTNSQQSNYEFLLDLSVLTLDEGEWQVRLFFDTGTTIYATPTINILGQPIGLINMDSTPPSISFNLFDSAAAPIALNGAVNTPINLEITCDDGAGIGCIQGAGALANFPQVEVKGNFCADSADCDHQGVRTYKVCDLVNNCAEQEVVIKNYDPIPPYLSGLEFGIADFFGSSLKANSDYQLSLDYVDPSRVQVNNAASGVMNKKIKIPQTEYDVLFDPDACGNSAVFENTGTLCEYTQTACVLPSDYTARGVLDGAGNCVPQCAANYSYDSGLGRCVADCSKTEFLPAFMCFDFDVH